MRTKVYEKKASSLQDKSSVVQQLKSKDGKICIDIVQDKYSSLLYPQCDFSFVSLSLLEDECSSFFKSFYRLQKSNHVMLLSARVPRKLKLKTMANACFAEEAGFKYHDYVTIIGDEHGRSSSNTLTQIGETCILMHKGDGLNKTQSHWFRPDIGDCGNVWDLGVQPTEQFTKKTHPNKFSYELGILMANLASPLICRKFLVIGSPEFSHAEFAVAQNLSMHCITSDEFNAKRVIKAYNKLMEQ